ncbi:hypothetical protein GCM10009555_018910 [Acrocarpospora macrocephala]|uniref:Uncharacterized protein n=1 Tax=Acrocarpospora macrocephala TaxID=150177 RepID=A0A5M3WK31_9ACTN|nr:hypothetical protein [Acrocarpospora macrocephala]GES07551.1 hypothetical protein Amac_011460 [Acrocarpospora macrocephala]
MTNDRYDMITGLRDLADFLETNPNIPAPRNVTIHHFPARHADDEMCAEVDKVAALLGSEINRNDVPHGYYRTSVHFGPVEYTALAVLAHRRATYEAETSYFGCVTPDIPACAT